MSSRSRSSHVRIPICTVAGLVAAVASLGCVHVAPPPSVAPTADDALARMHASFTCANAVQVDAKVDHYGPQGRLRGELLLYASRPASLRMDLVSPFGVALATLTSDGRQFALADLHDKRFYVGRATACNIARLTQVSVPGHVLVDLLRGEAPVLKHEPSAPTIAWDSRGYYVITIPSTRGAREELHLAPRPQDWALPWQQQRMRVLDVRVVQQGFLLYHAQLDDHRGAPTAGPREDPDNLEPPTPPSGPPCDAELPRRIRVEVPEPTTDVRFSYDKVSWNPPLLAGVFRQPPPGGMVPEDVECE